jgi:hypothetical protein
MPVRRGFPRHPYSFLIEKLDDLIIAQDHTGAVRFSGYDASTVIQSAINALGTEAGIIIIKPGTVPDDYTPPNMQGGPGENNQIMQIYKSDRIEWWFGTGLSSPPARRMILYWSGELEVGLHTGTGRTESDAVLIARVVGDTYDRCIIYGSGKIELGSGGNSPPDVAIFRNLPGRIRIMSPDGLVNKDIEVMHVISANKGVNVPVTQGATYVDITLPFSEVDANYGVSVTPQWNTTVWVTNKTITGFRVNFGTAPASDSAVDYFVYR